MNSRLQLVLVFGAGVGTGYLAARLMTPAARVPRGTMNAAASLLAAERAIEQMRPILTPMAAGRRPSLPEIARALR